jgi:hypothetical protein
MEDFLVLGKDNSTPTVASSSFFVLRPNTNKVDPEYLTAILNATQTKAVFQQIGGGTNIFSIRKSELGALQLPLPSMQQQKKYCCPGTTSPKRHGANPTTPYSKTTIIYRHHFKTDKITIMQKKLTPKEINLIVWRACDTFRGTIDATQYKDYILTMLFLKYVTDVWKDKRATYAEKYNHDEIRIERALRNERFQVPNECTFDYLFEQRNENNLGELINIALEKLEDANRNKLAGVFRNIDFNSEPNLGQTKDRNRRLKNLLVDFSELDLTTNNMDGNDIIGDAYEFLIAKFAGDAGKKAGEFYSPAEVSTLLAKLLAPQPGNRLCDPTCGSGSLLIKLGKEVGSNNYSLYGQENNGSTWALARMNMFLHELDNATIEWGDTINNP